MEVADAAEQDQRIGRPDPLETGGQGPVSRPEERLRPVAAVRVLAAGRAHWTVPSSSGHEAFSFMIWKLTPVVTSPRPNSSSQSTVPPSETSR
jgi:hypothetical protein